MNEPQTPAGSARGSRTASGEPRPRGGLRSIELAPDPELPFRDRLLDDRFIREWLSKHLSSSGPVVLEYVEKFRVKYSVGKSLRLVFRVGTRDGRAIVAARMLRPGSSEQEVLRASGPAADNGPLRSEMHAPDLDTLFWTYPNDRRIAALPWLDGAPRGLARLLRAPSVQTRVVAYTPERRVTVECREDTGKVLAYAKVFADEEFRRRAGIWRELERIFRRTGSGCRIPRVIRFSVRHRMIALEPIEGTCMGELEGQQLLAAMRSLGSAVASFHVPSPSGWLPFLRSSPDRVARAASSIAQVRPDVASAAGDLARRLDSTRDPVAEPAVCLHGDLHPKNGILADGRIVLIDLDQACAGPAAADLGSLLAYLVYAREIGALPSDVEQSLANAFLEGYGAVRDLPDRRSLRWHTAAALLTERAFRAVSRIRPEGLDRLERLLAHAGTLLDGKADG